MKFYIASKLENFEQVKVLSAKLKAAGWIHTYDWTTHLSVKETDEETLRRVGENELNGVADADVVIVLTPQGRGTHVEMGIAIGLGKRVYLCHADDKYFRLTDDTTSFYWLPQVTRFVGGTDEIAEELLRYGNKNRRT
jgi:nucleoside 2-deoxyribosyltransferase